MFIFRHSSSCADFNGKSLPSLNDYWGKHHALITSVDKPSRVPRGTTQTLPYPTHTPTLPYPTLPYPTLPYPTLPYPTLPYPTLPYPTLPYPTLPYPTLPYPTLPYPTLPYPTLPYPTLPLSYPTLPCPYTTSTLALPYHTQP